MCEGGAAVTRPLLLATAPNPHPPSALNRPHPPPLPRPCAARPAQPAPHGGRAGPLQRLRDDRALHTGKCLACPTHRARPACARGVPVSAVHGSFHRTCSRGPCLGLPSRGRTRTGAACLVRDSESDETAKWGLGMQVRPPLFVVDLLLRLQLRVYPTRHYVVSPGPGRRGTSPGRVKSRGPRTRIRHAHGLPMATVAASSSRCEQRRYTVARTAYSWSARTGLAA
jgi:hypothetical protein